MTKEILKNIKTRLENELKSALLPEHRKIEVQSLLYYVETFLKEIEKQEKGENYEKTLLSS